MRKLPLVLLMPALAVLPALWEPARGQGPIQPQVLYARQRNINIRSTKALRQDALFSGIFGFAAHLGDFDILLFFAETEGFLTFREFVPDHPFLVELVLDFLGLFGDDCLCFLSLHWA